MIRVSLEAELAALLKFFSNLFDRYLAALRASKAKETQEQWNDRQW
jgi:hypothetical protein